MEQKDRVQKIISNSGYCSRRKAEELIQKGHVKVNGKKITIGDKATSKDDITIDNLPLGQEKKRYLIFYKPKGYLTTLYDPKGRKTIFSFIKTKERVYPVGRLDQATEGILILTNDGDFANKIAHPRYEMDKTYEIYTDRPLHKRDQNKLEQGIMIQRKRTYPAKIKVISDRKFNITIHEGRNRILRTMMQKLDYKIQNLKRVRIGMVGLGSLKPGQYRNLSKREKEMLSK